MAVAVRGAKRVEGAMAMAMAMEMAVRGAKRVEGAMEEGLVREMERRRRKGVMASGSLGCLSRVGRVAGKGTRRGAATEAGLFVRRVAVVFSRCFVLFVPISLCLGSRRRVAVGGVGNGETESISLGL
jgi:hypothetical protein